MSELKSIIDSMEQAECASDGTLLRDPARAQPKRNIRKAIHHFRELIKNKEDTSHVFQIYEHLPSKHFMPRVRELALSPKGEELRRAEPTLPPILDNHDALRKLPKGSVAHAYCDFMEREGLSAAGLVAEAEKLGRPKYGDLVEWFGFRQRDTHDLMHVLTGYGRDALGEQCVLLFTHGQSPSPGHLVIGYAGALNIMKQVRSKAPVLKAVNEAKRFGRTCPPLVEMSIRELLAMDLQQARTMFGISDPVWYHKCHEVWRSEGVDPYDMLASKNDEPKLAAA